MSNIKQATIEFYLNWVNNWLSPQSMAEYYGLTTKQCIELIEIGREVHTSEFSIPKHNTTVKNSDTNM